LLESLDNHIEPPVVGWVLASLNGLMVLLHSIIAFALVRRLFKTSMFILIGYFLLTMWSFLRAENVTYSAVIIYTLRVFLLSLGVYGVYKEKKRLRRYENQQSL
jgi:hypothetical protein